MNESQSKRRGWIKNIVIIFLVVLLILTLFSNTILNYSLPEVAVQYPQYATIASRIRQTASVEANQSYSVSIEQTRVISSVEVRVGQTIQKGDVLFRLEEGDSSELAEANRTLQDLNIQLIQKLKADPSLSGSSSSMDDAISALKKSLSTAQDTLTEARATLADEEEKLAELQAQQEALPGYDQILSAKNLVAQIDANLEYLTEEIERLQGKQGQIGGDGYYTPAEIEELIADAEYKVQELNVTFGWALRDYDKAAAAEKKLESQYEAAVTAYDSAVEAYEDYANQTSGGSVSYDTLKEKQEAIQSLQTQLQQKQMYFTEAEYNTAYSNYVAAKTAYDAAYGKVTDAELQVLRTAMQEAADVLSPLEKQYQEIQNLQSQISSAQQEYWQAMMQYSQSSQQNSVLANLEAVRDQAKAERDALDKQLTAAKTDTETKKKAFEEAQIEKMKKYL